VSLPGGVFSAAGAGVKTSCSSSPRQSTDRIWYYDLSDVKVGKKTPFTLDWLEEFFRLLPDRTDSERSWTPPAPARVIEQDLGQWKDRLAQLRRAGDEAAIAEAEVRISAAQS